MASVPTFTASGTKAAASAKLEDGVFGIDVRNHELLKQAYTAYLSNGRTRNAAVKTRGLVSGGGKKPWRQKGTGRARFGSSRNPIWRGGGIVFGPTGEENFTKHLSTKAKRQAIRQALSLAARHERIVVVEQLAAKDGKTKAIAGLLTKVGATRRTLIVVDVLNDDLVRASSNLQDVKLIAANYLNVFDAMNADTIVLTKGGLDAINAWLLTEDKETER